MLWGFKGSFREGWRVHCGGLRGVGDMLDYRKIDTNAEGMNVPIGRLRLNMYTRFSLSVYIFYQGRSRTQEETPSIPSGAVRLVGT